MTCYLECFITVMMRMVGDYPSQENALGFLWLRNHFRHQPGFAASTTLVSAWGQWRVATQDGDYANSTWVTGFKIKPATLRVGHARALFKLQSVETFDCFGRPIFVNVTKHKQTRTDNPCTLSTFFFLLQHVTCRIQTWQTPRVTCQNPDQNAMLIRSLNTARCIFRGFVMRGNFMDGCDPELESCLH